MEYSFLSILNDFHLPFWVMRMVEMSREEVEALRRFLTWMRGFEESTLYEDYRRCEGFTDEEYVRTVNALWNVVNRAETEILVYTNEEGDIASIDLR